jgi:hypothetical protein
MVVAPEEHRPLRRNTRFTARATRAATAFMPRASASFPAASTSM